MADNDKKQAQLNFAQSINQEIMRRFAQMQKIQILDPNSTSTQSTNSYKKYTREQILTYLKDPKKNASDLIKASNYLYSSSTIYQRVVKYLAEMLTFDYVVTPYKMKDSVELDVKKYKDSYYKALNELEIINIKQIKDKIMTVVVREGAFFGIEIKNKDSHIIYKLPNEYCEVTSWEDGCPLFSMNMSYFDKNQSLAEALGLKSQYNEYLKDKAKNKYIEFDSNSSVCILFDESAEYIVPPFAGAFSDIYLLEDYKDLMKSRETINLYKLINLKYPTDDEGNLLMDEEVARTYYKQFINQLSDVFAVTLNPFELQEVSFDKNSVEEDTTLKAQRDMFSQLGVSDMLFNNSKASNTALIKSIDNDVAYVLPALRSFERWVNKKLKNLSGTIKFQAMFLETTIYNRSDVAKMYKDSATLGLPTKMLFAAANGLTPYQIMGLNFMENNVLALHENFIPLSSSYNSNSSGEAGRPKSDEPLTDKGEDAIDDNMDRIE